MSAIEPLHWDDLVIDAQGRIVCPACDTGVMVGENACEGATWLVCESCDHVELLVE